MTSAPQPPVAPEPPVAPRRDFARDIHGDVVNDPWAWMKDQNDPQLRSHLEAENAYTAARTSHLEPLQQQIFDEIKAHTKQDDASVPVRYRDWWYYSRTGEGKQYEIQVRAPYVEGAPMPDPSGPVAGEQVIVDANIEADGREFYELAASEVSIGGDLVALLVDLHGDESYDLTIRRIDTGEVVDDGVRGVSYDLVWSLADRFVFYVRRDDAWRAYEVWRHEVGRPVADDVRLFREDDPQFSVGIGASRDDRWLTIRTESRLTCEEWLLDLADPTSAPRVIEPRTPGLDYSVEVDADRILVTHNANHPDFELASAPLDAPAKENWTTVLPAHEGRRIMGVQAFREAVAIVRRREGLRLVEIMAKTPAGYGPPTEIPAAATLPNISLGSNAMWDAATIRLTMQSFISPRCVLELDPNSGQLTVLRRQEVPDFDPGAYVEERLWVTARDGAQVPVSLVHRRDVVADGTAGGFLYGYGSYEASIDPYFSVLRLSMLDRGVVFALAHVRGGGEMGRAWYDHGKLLEKPNTFHDFVDVGRALIESGWVHPERLSAEGESAGGLLIGAAINEAPQLFRAVHAGVPFVDALTTILDPSLPLTAGEWEEWGNPIKDELVYRCMKGYTPYENVRATAYPSVLATTSVFDMRVFFVEPTKWVQQLRATVTSDPETHPILLKCELISGHGGASGRYDAWRDAAFELAFLLGEIGAAERVDRS